jgi:ABC-type dipeptide/oligopeptide/nickel transport system ATPase component
VSAHQSIIGQSGSGKSSLVREICANVKGTGVGVLVFDPTQLRSGKSVDGWPADYVFNEWEPFKAHVWESRGCYVVIDEAPEACEIDGAGVRSMLMRGRHLGHVFALCGQRYKRLDKTARDQCGKLFAFMMAEDDAAELAKDWADPALANLNTKPKFHYTHKIRGEIAVEGVTKPF